MRQKWPWVLIIGIAAFIASDLFLRSSNNSGFLTLTLVIGALVVPVTMVTFFYERMLDRDISTQLLVTSFLLGGAIGLLAAFLVENWTLTYLGPGQLIAVGFIEESAKLIFPLGMYFVWHERHQADGLNFGVAAGMGFAALETMGYAASALMESHGSVGALEQSLVLRGLLSPAGHAAWTGIVCAILWRERERAGHKVLNFREMLAFFLAVGLHIIWDVASILDIPETISYALLFLVAAVSFSLLISRYREARRHALDAAAMPA